MAVFVDKLLIALGIDPRGAEQGLDRVNNSVDRTDAKLDELKHKAGDVARSIAMQIAGPLLAAFSVGKMVQGYISDVAEVAEQTGAYNKKLEEERLKKAQLQRVTKEDIELYKRGREVFAKFQIAMSDFSAKLMRTLMPFIKDLLDKLNRFSNWISHNSNNIIRFLTILASTITLALIPAVAKFTAALLKNPLAWVALLVVALALAIDDLIVYLKGGRSEFDAFWKWLGFAKGDTETLTKAINWLKTSGVDLLKTIGKLTAAFVGMRAVWGVISMVRKAWNALSLSVLANPVVLAIGLLVTAAWMLYKNWDDVCEGAKALWEDLTSLFMSWCRSMADGIAALADDVGSALSGIWQGVKDGASALAEDAGSALADTWRGMKEGAAAVGETIADAFATAVSAISDSMAWAGEKIDEGLTAVSDFVSGTWQGMKDGASALVDDIEDAFSGLTQWFSALWGKITGIFDRALGKIKSGITSVTDALGLTHTPETPSGLMTPEEMKRQKEIIIETKKSKTGSYDSDDEQWQHARAPGERHVTKGTLKTADKVKALQEQMTAYSLGVQKAAGVKAAPVNSGSVSNVRNSTQKSTINNDNRRQEVNITVNGNADTKTVGQIKDGVTGVFAQGAASPVMG